MKIQKKKKFFFGGGGSGGEGLGWGVMVDVTEELKFLGIFTNFFFLGGVSVGGGRVGGGGGQGECGR